MKNTLFISAMLAFGFASSVFAYEPSIREMQDRQVSKPQTGDSAPVDRHSTESELNGLAPAAGGTTDTSYDAPKSSPKPSAAFYDSKYKTLKQ